MNPFEMMIVITALMIPITAILTYHQRKMAEIVHGKGATPAVINDLENLRREVHEMRHLLHQQTIALDSALNALRIPSEETNRLGGR